MQLEERAVGGSGLLTGTWTARFDSARPPASGTVSGTSIGGVVDASLAPVPRVACAPAVQPYAVLAGGFSFRVADQGGRLSGSVESWSCTAVASGVIELAR